MKPFNVEIFNRQFELLAHTNVDDIKIDYDYLSPNESELEIRLTGFYDTFAAEAVIHKGGMLKALSIPALEGLMDAVGVGAYIRFQRDDMDIFGVITSMTTAEDALLTKIGIQPFPSAIFTTDILFDTNKQGTVALETVIADLITASWINNADTLQNIPGLTVTTTSSTVSWGMNLKSDTEGMHHCIIDFYDVLIRRALEEYGIAIHTSVDFQNGAINLTIGKVVGTQTIEADLPNVFDRTFLINESSKNTNKLDVYNSANYTSTIIYYKHTDGTYNTTNNKRLYPVVREVQAVDVEEGSTFAQAAASAAASVFGEVTYSNLIEIKCLYDDSLIMPKQLNIGSVVTVIHDGNAYSSIMTGYQLENNVINLIFGSIRADLTKLLRRNK
ncbi:MAG: hypothetical protein IIZ94_02020 [Prevotella sp.]|nr:hypothetical protein [Prevotella sp.]